MVALEHLRKKETKSSASYSTKKKKQQILHTTLAFQKYFYFLMEQGKEDLKELMASKMVGAKNFNKTNYARKMI